MVDRPRVLLSDYVDPVVNNKITRMDVIDVYSGWKSKSYGRN